MKDSAELRMARSYTKLTALLKPAWPSLFLLYWNPKPISLEDIERECGRDAMGFFEACIWNAGLPGMGDFVATAEPTDWEDAVNARGLTFILTKRGRSFMRALVDLMTGVEWWKEHGARFIDEEPS